MTPELAAAVPKRVAPPTNPLVSIVIKCLNEEKNIERCIRSLMTQAGCDAEIILADCLSSDRTIEIARGFPIRIVQLLDPATRGCAAAGQLGWQYARGEFLCLLDADMQLCPGFLPAALDALERDPSLAGVGGVLIEMSSAIEYRERLRRPNSDMHPGFVQRLTGLVVYRMAALGQDGYFMDRNLKAQEELDAGLRLRARGWRLRILPLANVWHYGHTNSSLRLHVRRWRSQVSDGGGQLLRAAVARAKRPADLTSSLLACRFQLLTIGWWTLLCILLAVAGSGHPLGVLAPIVFGLPFTALLVRKRDLTRVLHSFIGWNITAAGLLRGLASRRVPPRERLPSIALQEPAGR